MQQLQNVIESAFERRAEITPAMWIPLPAKRLTVISLLDSGALRVAEKSTVSGSLING